MKPSERLGTMVPIRVDDALATRLDALVSKLGGHVPRSHVARAALRLGVDALEQDPAALLAVLGTDGAAGGKEKRK